MTGTDAGALAATLETLADRLEANLEVVATVWDGPWQTLADTQISPRRKRARRAQAAARTAFPAAFVSLLGFALEHRARSRFRPGQLRAARAGDPAAGFPAPGQGPGPGAANTGPTAPQPHLRAEIAVSFVDADPDASARATMVATLAEAAVPVLMGFQLTDIRGSSLYTAALTRRGLAAFVLTGRRDIELAPPAAPRAAVSRVDAVSDAGGVRERITVWERDAG